MLLRYLILFFFHLNLFFVVAQRNKFEIAFERFKNNAEKFGFKKDDAIVFKIGQVTKLSNILN